MANAAATSPVDIQPDIFLDLYKNSINSSLVEPDYKRLLNEAGLNELCFVSNRNQYLGNLLYLHVLNSPESSPDNMNHLKIAALVHGSFHAALYRLTDIFHEIDQANTVDMDFFLHTLRELIDYISVVSAHLTPGYILASHAWLWLDCLYQKLNADDRSEHPASSMNFLYNAMTSITIAHELHDFSKPEIHNAYGPEGLHSSNAFRTGNTEKMVGYVFRLFREKCAPSYDLAHFQEAARHSVRKLWS